jgi:hypothetical protein
MEIVKAALDFFHEGEWPMWPILVLGMTAFAFASRLALTAKRALVGPVLGLSLATLLVGCFGFRHGLSHQWTDVFSDGQAFQLALVGLREAINCPTLALGLVMPTLLLASLGVSRATTSRSA